jgi:3-hydroxyacyl-[acyl-carrier-protein] dehydratase
MPAQTAFLGPSAIPCRSPRSTPTSTSARPSYAIFPCRAPVYASADAAASAAAAPAPEAIGRAPETPSWLGAEAMSSSATVVPGPSGMSVDEVMRVLPHRYPFLLVDKVIAFESGKRAVAVKAVSVNEPFFQGHFPDRPIMPGVLQVEALAQTGGIVMRDLIAGEGGEKRDFFFGGVDNVRWRKPVVPGDVLFMEATLTSYKARFGIAKVSGKAYVDGKLACEADLTLVVDVRGKAKNT